jgi:hypothetical protein
MRRTHLSGSWTTTTMKPCTTCSRKWMVRGKQSAAFLHHLCYSIYTLLHPQMPWLHTKCIPFIGGWGEDPCWFLLLTNLVYDFFVFQFCHVCLSPTCIDTICSGHNIQYPTLKRPASIPEWPLLGIFYDSMVDNFDRLYEWTRRFLTLICTFCDSIVQQQQQQQTQWIPKWPSHNDLLYRIINHTIK